MISLYDIGIVFIIVLVVGAIVAFFNGRND